MSSARRIGRNGARAMAGKGTRRGTCRRWLAPNCVCDRCVKRWRDYIRRRDRALAERDRQERSARHGR